LNHVPGDAINPLQPVELDATPDFASAFGSTADITVLDSRFHRGLSVRPGSPLPRIPPLTRLAMAPKDG